MTPAERDAKIAQEQLDKMKKQAAKLKMSVEDYKDMQEEKARRRIEQAKHARESRAAAQMGSTCKDYADKISALKAAHKFVSAIKGKTKDQLVAEVARLEGLVAREAELRAELTGLGGDPTGLKLGEVLAHIDIMHQRLERKQAESQPAPDNTVSTSEVAVQVPGPRANNVSEPHDEVVMSDETSLDSSGCDGDDDSDVECISDEKKNLEFSYLLFKLCSLAKQYGLRVSVSQV